MAGGRGVDAAQQILQFLTELNQLTVQAVALDRSSGELAKQVVAFARNDEKLLDLLGQLRLLGFDSTELPFHRLVRRRGRAVVLQEPGVTTLKVPNSRTIGTILTGGK